MKKMNPEKLRSRRALTVLLAAIIFLFILLNFAVVAGIVMLLLRSGILSSETAVTPYRIIVSMAIGSIVLGSILSGIFSRIPFRPISTIIDAMNALAHGHFETRLHFSGRLSRYPTAVEITESFNNMAEELEKTEMLRSDFVNNFSHEFKTPIVSIAGFADLLMDENVGDENKAEYIRIISDEAHRLSDMATNVLNLTKIENQVILTDVERFNLSEQLRGSILLLENKWTEKQLVLEAGFEDHYYSGNREMLKQVWLNLIDNAVKFSDYGGAVKVSIDEKAESLTVSVANSGAGIPEESLPHIFDRFYQADESHATAGNGIGLAVVKAITELHGGSVSASSNDGWTVVTVVLPK